MMALVIILGVVVGVGLTLLIHRFCRISSALSPLWRT